MATEARYKLLEALKAHTFQLAARRSAIRRPWIGELKALASL
jgi:hypothetical protein